MRLKRICHLVYTCLTLCCFLSCRWPRAHHLPLSLFLSPRHRNSHYNRTRCPEAALSTTGYVLQRELHTPLRPGPLDVCTLRERDGKIRVIRPSSHDSQMLNRLSTRPVHSLSPVTLDFFSASHTPNPCDSFFLISFFLSLLIHVAHPPCAFSRFAPDTPAVRITVPDWSFGLCPWKLLYLTPCSCPPCPTIRNEIVSRNASQRWDHHLHTSPDTSHCMEAVFSKARKICGKPPSDPMEDLNVNLAIWRMFINKTLRAAVHLGKDYDTNLTTGQVWTKNGGRIFHGMSLLSAKKFKISCLLGRHHMKGGSECPSTAQLSRLEQWSNITPFLRKTYRDCISSAQKSCQVFFSVMHKTRGRIWKGDTQWSQTLKSWSRWTHQNYTPESSMRRKC